jgi:hypothetical protein
LHSAEIGEAKIWFSCIVEPGEPECSDYEFAHPGTPDSLSISTVWLAGHWVDVQDVLDAALIARLEEEFLKEIEA